MNKTKISWLVLGGCPRSGTTMLNFVLNSHPQICLTNEISLKKMMDRIHDLFYKEQQIKAVTQEIPERKKGKKEKWSIKKDILPLVLQEDQCKVSVLETLYTTHFLNYTNVDNIKYFGDKYPPYYQDFDDLRTTLNPLKVIHISRHPFDVINSMLRRSLNSQKGLDFWNPSESVDSACLKWVNAWNFINKYSFEYPQLFLHVKYEDFVFDFFNQMEIIANFLEIEDITKFNSDIVIQDNHYERELLSSENEELVYEYIPKELIESWEMPVAELAKKFPSLKTLEKSDQKYVAANNSDADAANKVKYKIPRKIARWLISSRIRNYLKQIL